MSHHFSSGDVCLLFLSKQYLLLGIIAPFFFFIVCCVCVCLVFPSHSHPCHYFFTIPKSRPISIRLHVNFSVKTFTKS